MKSVTRLAADRVNIYGLTISDTVDHAVVRMVVSDTRKALAIFESRGTLVVETDVLMIENDNKPGSLSRIAKVLSSHKINIEYAYLASMPTARKGLLILRVQDPKESSEAPLRRACRIEQRATVANFRMAWLELRLVRARRDRREAIPV